MRGEASSTGDRARFEQSVTGQDGAPTRTALAGGCGIVLGSLYALAVALSEALPIRGSVIFGDPLLQLLSTAIVAVSFGILAFGLPQESGIGGESRAGQALLFTFGMFRFVLDLAALLSAGAGREGGVADGCASVGVTVVGLVAGVLGSIMIVHAKLLRGYARWALLPVATVLLVELIFSFIPLQLLATVSFQLHALGVLLTTVAGISYAIDGRGRSIREGVGALLRRW